MKLPGLSSFLSLLNYAVGVLIGYVSLSFYFKYKSVAPLYITLAIIIGGPLEDILVQFVKSLDGVPHQKKKEYLTMVDQFTSLGFLLFLLLAVLEAK
jgi:hypothetical protein